MNSSRPIIGISMGDPAGIGPEVAVKALSQSNIYEVCRPVVVGEAKNMAGASKIADMNLSLNTCPEISAAKFQCGTIDVLDLQNVNLKELRLGKISAQAGRAAF